MLRILRSPPTDGSVAVEFRMDDRANLISADRSGHEGFGELFRSLSFQEIGAAAMLSRAIGGVVSGKIVLAMPGSESAVRLAMSRLIIPELSHMVWLVTSRGGEI